MMIHLKNCLACNAISRQYIYEYGDAPEVARLPGDLTPDKAEGNKDKPEREPSRPEKAQKAAEKRAETKEKTTSDTTDALQDLKAMFGKGIENIKKLRELINASPDEIRYALYTYASANYMKHRDPSGKAKRIMGKIIEQIKERNINLPLVFQGGADGSIFNLSKVKKLPDAWHEEKQKALGDLLDVSLIPDSVAAFRDSNRAIIAGYINCDDVNERNEYLEANKDVFCGKKGLFNMATAYQRALHLGRSFPGAVPSAFRLDLNDGQGRRFRTSAVYVGIDVIGRKPRPKPTPPPERVEVDEEAPPAAPFENQQVDIDAFSKAYEEMVDNVAKINRRFGTHIDFKRYQGDMKLGFYRHQGYMDFAKGDKNLYKWTAHCIGLSENIYKFERALMAMKSDALDVIKKMHIWVEYENGPVSIGENDEPNFKIDIRGTEGEMRGHMESIAKTWGKH